MSTQKNFQRKNRLADMEAKRNAQAAETPAEDLVDESADQTPAETPETVNTAVEVETDTQVPETPETPQETAPEPVVEPVVEPAAETPQSFLKTKYPRLLTIAPQIEHLILRLQEYEEAMGDHVPVSPELGGQHQRRLFATFKMALGMPNGLHRQAIDVVLWYFNKYRMSAFSDRLICRYTDPSRMTRQESQAFSLLCTLFRSTANPLTRRQALQTTNIRLVVERLNDHSLQHNLLDYFTSK